MGPPDVIAPEDLPPTVAPRTFAPPVAGTDERQAALLLALATRITSTLDLQEVLDESFAALRQLVDFGGGAIQLVEDGALVAAASDPVLEPEARRLRIPLGKGVSGTIAVTGKHVYIPDITVDPRVHPEGRRSGVTTGVRSYLGVPLISGGTPIGVLQIDSPHVAAFDASIRALVLGFVPTISAAVQNARVFEQEQAVARSLREADRLKKDFLSIVSHELRTPLTTMSGFAELLQNRAGELPTEQVGDLAGRIVAAGRRLDRLIGDLLYASKLEQGFFEIQLAPTDVRAVVESVAAADADPAHGAHPIETEVVGELPVVSTDPDRLHQILANLVDNARKYSDDGTPIRIRATWPRQATVDVTVEDRGRGIPESAQPAIFQLFYQAEAAETRSAGGLGIGLYVVKRLADAMGAVVSVDDLPEGGSRFTVSLPVVQGG